MKTIPHPSVVRAVESCDSRIWKQKKCGIAALAFLILLGSPLGFGTRAFADAAWGNTFNGGNTAGSLYVTNSNSQWTTFTADSNFQVSSIWINSNTAMAASTSMNVELYAVDTGTGLPTGAALASQTFSSAPTGWNQFSGFNYTLTQGSQYAIRLSAASGNPLYAWRYLDSTTPAPYDNKNYVQPVSGDTDSHWARGYNSNGPYTVGQAVWLMESSSGQGFGQPYNASTAPNLGSATVAVGQRFRFDALDPINMTLQSVEVPLIVSSTPPANPLTARLLADDGTILATGTLDLSSASEGIDRYEISFASSYQLTDQDIYYLALYSTNSVSNSVRWAGASTNQTGDATFLDSTFQGQVGYGVTWNSQSDFSTVATTTKSADYRFNLGLVPEPSTAAMLVLAGAVLILGARGRRVRA